MIVQACDPGTPEAEVLLGELSAALAAMTGDNGRSSYDPDDSRGARSLFVIARDASGLLGCGALRPVDERVAEIKRMYARPGTTGVGAAILNHLELAARSFDYDAVCLSTRRINYRAVDFYLKHGYTEIASYGKYADRPESICLGKSLLPSAARPLTTA